MYREPTGPKVVADTEEEKEEEGEARVIDLKYIGHYPLHDAARHGDADAIVVLAKRRDVNAYNKEGVTPLHLASTAGHTEAVRSLLAVGADVGINDQDLRRSALHFSCLAGHTSAVDLLLARGAGVHERDLTGAYPMHLAAEGGFSDVIEQLLAVKATVDCLDADHSQPIHYAAKHDRVSAIVTLHFHGAPVEASDKDGARPIHYAAKTDSCNALHKLKQLGASLDIIDTVGGSTPVHYASRSNRPLAVHKLALLGANLNARNKKNECALHIAASLGHHKVCFQLVRCGVKVDVPYKKGRQAVHIAAENGHSDVITAMKTCGADLNCKDKVGDRPLHYAIRAEQETVTQTLVHHGANVNAAGKRGNSPLHVAAKERKARMVLLLCTLRADCNVENDNCLFPVYYTALNEDLACMKQLVRFGAKINKLNSEGQSMLEVMLEEDKLPAMAMMKQFKANMDVVNSDGKTCVHLATEALKKTTLLHLMSLGADINFPDNHGLAALHIATMNNSMDQVCLLDEVRADLNTRTHDYRRGLGDPELCRDPWPPGDLEREDYWKHRTGMTAVHLALLYGHLDALRLLVDCGADINESNDAGETVFHCAALFKMTDWYEELVKLGADRNRQDSLGRSAVHYAVYSGDQENVRYLLKNGAMAHAEDNDGRQPLHYACQGGHFLLFSDLLGHSRSVDINCRDKFGRTPLHFAASAGMIETMMELVHLKADIHCVDKAGNTPLHLAAESGSHKAIVQLASLGCNIDAKNKDAKTALHLAAEKGQGQAMEFLLMCGANPTIRDKGEMLPTTFKVRGPLKDSIAKRIRDFNAHRTSKYRTGEIDFESRTVPVGKHVNFERLHVSVVLDSSTKTPPIIFIHRTPAEEKHLQVPLQGLEEILSDVYEIRVLRLEVRSALMLELPMDGYPGKFEATLRTTENQSFQALTTSEQNGVPVFVGKIPVHEETVYRCAVVVRPKMDAHSVTSDGGVVMADVNRRIRVEVPSGAFSRDTELSFQVLETEKLDGFKEAVLAADVVNLTSSERFDPQRSVTVQLPLHDNTIHSPDEVMVFGVEHNSLLYDETRWRPLDSRWKVQNHCVVFSVRYLSVFVAVKSNVEKSYAVDGLKRLAREKIRKALQRETAVVFFHALSPRKDAFLTIFECTTPGKFRRRSEFWEKEGFSLHPLVKHSGHFVAKPNQRFAMKVFGNLRHVGSEGKQFSLSFNPRAYKYQSFYITIRDKKQSPLGQIDVFKVPEAPRNAKLDSASENQGDSFLTSIPVELPSTPSCTLS